MRVFISSTVYDLIDVRVEVAKQLEDLGITPILSDDKLSDFRVDSEVNSIETCLVNLASCDSVIVILDKRYGPSLEKVGYDDISATHLEYRKAKENGIPIHVFSRDRLEADFAIWKRNGRKADLRLSWIEKKEFKILELLDEHAKLSELGSNNWYSTFSNSLDLKLALVKLFEGKILPKKLVQAIESNTFPIFDIQYKSNQEISGYQRLLKLEVTVKNGGGAPAFDFSMGWETGKKESTDRSIIVPGQSVSMVLLCDPSVPPCEISTFLRVEYSSSIGVLVSERYRVYISLKGSVLMSGANLVVRKFRRGGPVRLELEE